MKFPNFKSALAATALAAVLLIGGCRKEDMGSQPKVKPLQESIFFANHASARRLIEGTVARGQLHADKALYTGMRPGFFGPEPVDSFPSHYPTGSDGPFPTSGPALREVLKTGQQKFTIFCAMCHGDLGEGNGIIVQRGFVVPPSYHIDRLRAAPVGHFFDVISNGYGAMYSYGDRISPADRWAIVAYIRTLQLSQAIDKTDLPPAEITKMNEQVKAQ